MVTRSVGAERVPVMLRLPFAASSVAVARQHLKRWMTAQDYAREQIEDARVVVSELVANSVRHASPLADGNILVSWCVDHRGLQLSITDGGSSTRPRKLNAPSSALAGRGMAIVESLALSWWAEQNRTRSTVHALLSLS